MIKVVSDKKLSQNFVESLIIGYKNHGNIQHEKYQSFYALEEEKIISLNVCATDFRIKNL